MEKKKAKKVGNLKEKECEVILARLDGQTECRYYNHVLYQYSKLKQKLSKNK